MEEELPSNTEGGEMAVPIAVEDDRSGGETHKSLVVDIYPLCNYYFGSKQAHPIRDECSADRLLRIKSNYAAYGMRTCVRAVILVELSKQAHILLLQVRNSVYELPGGHLRPGEMEADCMVRKLLSKLSITVGRSRSDCQLGECLGMWWRPDFEKLMYPYLLPNFKRPKECIKLFLVKLPATLRFGVPKNYKLLAVPLCQIHENPKTYGPIISGVTQLLSRFSFNIMES